MIVTATGFDGVLGSGSSSQQVADGAILVNVGHSDREIDVDWLDRHPRVEMRRHLDRYEIAGRRVYLLNRGSLVNLAAGLGIGARSCSIRSRRSCCSGSMRSCGQTAVCRTACSATPPNSRPELLARSLAHRPTEVHAALAGLDSLS